MAKMMTRAVIVAPGRVELEQVPIPKPGPRQGLVRIKACGICTWEMRVFKGSDKAGFYPMLGGHEISGIVEELGAGSLPGVNIGDHVAIGLDNLVRCHQCDSCRRGNDNLCDNLLWQDRISNEPFGPGGFGEYLAVDTRRMFRIDDSVPFVEAALAEPLACVLRSLKKASVHSGDYIVVVGAGIMGLLHLILAKRAQTTVIVSEPIPTRAEMARALGADHTINPLQEDFVARVRQITSDRGADIIFVAVGIAGAVEQSIQAVAKAGRVHCYASFHPRGMRISLDPNLFHGKEIVLTGTVGQDHEDFLRAAAILSSRALDLKPLISRTYPLSQISTAFEDAQRADTYRVVLTM